MRAVEELERAGAGRLARLDVVERDTGSIAPIGACRSVAAPSVARTHARPSGPAVSVAASPAGTSAAARPSSATVVEGAGSLVREDERVVQRVVQVERRARREPKVVERELGAALGGTSGRRSTAPAPSGRVS